MPDRRRRPLNRYTHPEPDKPEPVHLVDLCERFQARALTLNQIATELGVPTGSRHRLRGAIAALIRARHITASGPRRGKTYHFPRLEHPSHAA